MTIDDKIKVEKLQYGINREAAKISALPSGINDKYQYLTSEEILPSNQKQTIEQTKFAYSPLGEAFEKQTEKQVGALKSLNSSNKKDELKQIEDILSQNLMNKKIVNLQDIMKTDKLT